MGCTNEITLNELMAAVGVASILQETTMSAVTTALLANLDFGTEAVRITKETGVNTARGGLAAEVGDLAEAQVASALAGKGLEVLHVNTAPNEKGIDLVVFDSETDRITVVEVKSTLDPDKIVPTLSNTNDGKQTGHKWIDARLEAAAGLAHVSAREVDVVVMAVNHVHGTMQPYSVDEHGRALAAMSGPVAFEDAP